MQLQIDAKGIMSIKGSKGGDYDVYAGATCIGRFGGAGASFPLHGLSNNESEALARGITAKPVDKSDRNYYSIDIAQYIDAYHDSDLIRELRESIGGGKWVVYSVWIEKSKFVVADIGIVLPLSLGGAKFAVKCQGREARETHVSNDPHFERSHWFMPCGNVLGVRCRFELDSIPTFVEFTIDFEGDAAEAMEYGPILNYTDPAVLKGLPDLARIHRVASSNANHNSFINGGRTVYVRLSNIATKHGIDLTDPSLRVLDWGVGCGRIIRHFEELATPHLWGIDIDADNVEFCNQTLRSQSVVVPLDPPTSFEASSFDLIYSCSVLSHLTENAVDAWLTELSRLLSLRGIALLSFNGSSNSASYLSRRPLEFKRLIEFGFFDKDINHELDGFIPGGDYYRATFATNEWWRSRFEKFFEVVAVEHAVVNGHQDIAVLRKRR